MAVTSIAAATNSVNNGIGVLAQNYETFLHLLTTQLKNQDPLSPLDNNQFTQQLTQMTGVQQQLLTNQLLTQLLGQGQADLGGGAVNLIGKLVTVESNDAVVEDGKASWTYALPAEASDSTLSILDSNGKTIWSAKGADNAKGEHTLAWDGKDRDGNAVKEGATFTLKIEAKTLEGKAMETTASVTGLASRLQTLNGQTMLTVGKIIAPLTSVTSVQTAPS
jgi:flagellar basal-body rod modification protein FlgD